MGSLGFDMGAGSMNSNDLTAVSELKGVLLAALGEQAQARVLTATKTECCIKRDGSEVTGFVVTDKRGQIGVIDKSACRWLTFPEWWWVMHESAQHGRLIEQGPSCEWKADEDGNWDTGCLNKHVLTTGTPAENGHVFCCYCGRQIGERTERGE